MSDAPKKLVISANTAWNLLSRTRLLSALKNDGWEVTACAAPDEHAMRITESTGIPFIALPMKSDSTNVFQDFLLFMRYLGLYSRIKPQAVLHINNKPNIWGTLAANLLGIPSISNITGLGVVAEKKGVIKKLVYALYKVAFRSGKAWVFFQNSDDSLFFRENGLVADMSRTRLLPGSGVDLAKYAINDAYCYKDSGVPPVFLFSGRLLITKGIRVYIQAAQRVVHLYPGTRFIIIGELEKDNPVFIPDSELSRAVTSGLVEYCGKVQDVRSYLEEADCVVLPSWYREGVPRALLEAAACGKPLIAADSPGTREPVEHGVNGYRVIPEDVSSLVEAMLHFITLTDKQKKAMGCESRCLAEKRFSDLLVLEAYLETLATFGGST